MMLGASSPRSAGPLTLARRLFFSEYLVLWLSVAYVAVLTGISLDFRLGFFTPANFFSVLSTLLPLFVVSVGVTVVLISGGIDLSVTSTIAMTSVFGAMVMNGTDGWLAGHALATPAAVVLMLGLGVFMGFVNGAAITCLRMPPFMVTLTGMMFFSGLAIWITKSKNIGDLPASFTQLGGRIGIAVAIAAAVAGFIQLMLSHSVYGKWLYAAGHNPRAALVSGVPVGGVIQAAYVTSGFCAAAASVLFTGQAETASPVLGQRILLDVIGATVIGGTSLFGGRGKIVWTLGGVVFLKLIDNSMDLMSLSNFAVTMVKGTVILFAALMDALRTRLAGGT